MQGVLNDLGRMQHGREFNERGAFRPAELEDLSHRFDPPQGRWPAGMNEVIEVPRRDAHGLTKSPLGHASRFEEVGEMGTKGRHHSGA